jgi:hypothetical protein
VFIFWNFGESSIDFRRIIHTSWVFPLFFESLGGIKNRGRLDLFSYYDFVKSHCLVSGSKKGFSPENQPIGRYQYLPSGYD